MNYIKILLVILSLNTFSNIFAADDEVPIPDLNPDDKNVESFGEEPKILSKMNQNKCEVFSDDQCDTPKIVCQGWQTFDKDDEQDRIYMMEMAEMKAREEFMKTVYGTGGSEGEGCKKVTEDAMRKSKLNGQSKKEYGKAIKTLCTLETNGKQVGLVGLGGMVDYNKGLVGVAYGVSCKSSDASKDLKKLMNSDKKSSPKNNKVKSTNNTPEDNVIVENPSMDF